MKVKSKLNTWSGTSLCNYIGKLSKRDAKLYVEFYGWEAGITFKK
jgi:hypothetical protein